ncbi:hypothetical protein JJJ17_11170 [Paracoccus caeni]|uniref:Phage tail protein n=1 Tax=Paracoccus caeni TaxID=657651 RepID=A0A934SJH9_9RHOB|nr:phage tail protein [Paracoccus caeni]MBK4216487.1 hypothetical protein [Paracoccus caeni]
MSGSTLARRLRAGLDPNGSFWAVLRYPQDWAKAAGEGASWDPARGGLILAPQARPEIAQDWLPLAPVNGPGGALYRADTETGRILRKLPCDEDFIPMPGIGGEGSATGRFRAPAGLALDGHGRLYVADPGNRRVQVIDLAEGHVVAVLEAGLVLPVHTAIAPDGTVFVADAGTGALHVFSKRFQPCEPLPLKTLDPLTGTPWGDDPAPRPLAVALLDDGTLAAFDPLRPMLWHMTRNGRALPALGWFDDADLPPGWSPTPRRHDAEATLLLGPIDGGIHDLAWHRIEIDADLPQGTGIALQTYASNDPDDPLRAWAPERPTPLPQLPTDRAEGGMDRLIRADDRLWPLWRLDQMSRRSPVVAMLESGGPNGSASFDLPRDLAGQMLPGDDIRLTTLSGDEITARIEAISPAEWTVSAHGDPALLAAPANLALIQRDGSPLPYGPVDLGMMIRPLPALVLTGNPRRATMPLPAALAALLAEGDVLELRDGTNRARLELIEPLDETVTVTLTQPVAGDFSTCTVTLEVTPGRLPLDQSLPQTGPLPAGSQLVVVSDDDSLVATPLWTDARTGTIWLSEPLAGKVTAEDWTNARFPEPAATDRGRYLWLRLRMTGRGLPSPGRVGPSISATASPVLRSLRITAPRYSLLQWLPPLFSEHDITAEPPGANFLERFLSLFEERLTEAETALDRIPRQMNPRGAPDEWLAFIASWLDLDFDPSWPTDARRQLVIEGAALQAGRGTVEALRRALEIYTTHPVGIVEAYRTRPPAPIQLGKRGALGVAPLGGETQGTDLAHRFAVTVTLPGRTERRAELAAVRKIIDDMKPAHTEYTLRLGGAGAARIGMGTQIGAIVIPGPKPADPCSTMTDITTSCGTAGLIRLGGVLAAEHAADPRSQGGANVQMA